VELVSNDTLGGYSRDLPRYNHSVLFKMRKDMVDYSEGQVRMTVQVPLDNMKRVTVREQDYFYRHIPHSGFSLGLALPSQYGKYRVNGGLQLEGKNSFNASEILSGEKWRVHPDWLYCKFNNNFKKVCSQEDSLKHFLGLMGSEKNFNWGKKSNTQLLPDCKNYNPSSWDTPSHCRNQKAKSNPYYCDKELVQAFALDAVMTNIPSSRDEEFEQSGIEFSFVATRSGLSRWEGYKDQGNAEKPPVGAKATEELWYQRAVEFNHQKPHSFLFSVNHPSDSPGLPDTITATHAVFKEMKGHKAPAAVVGVQMDYHKLDNIFMDKANLQTQSGDMMSCRNETIGCYVVDNSGFIVISPDRHDAGKFFGEVEGAIMNSLVKNQVFKKVKIFDYQGVCMEEEEIIHEESSADMLLTPFKLLSQVFNWILGQIAVTIIHLEIQQLGNIDWAYTFAFPQEMEYDDYAYDYYNGDEDIEAFVTQDVFDTEFDNEHNEELEKENKRTVAKDKMKTKPCDKELFLYDLEDDGFSSQEHLEGILRHCNNNNCERPFTVSLIPHTNLVLIVADMTCLCDKDTLSIMATNVDYDRYDEYEYQMINTNNSYRQKVRPNAFYHPEEEEIHLCGGSGQGWVTISPVLITGSLLYNLVMIIQQ